MSQQMKNQSPLRPNVTPSGSTTSRPKDLTDTLLANNLNQLNWSTTNKTPTSTPSLPNATTPNYISMSAKNAFSPTGNTYNAQSNSVLSSSSNTPQPTFSNRMQPSTMSWNQTVPQNFNVSPSAMQLGGANTGWTTPSMMLPNATTPNSNSRLQSPNAPKLSTEEIMDFLK